LSLHPATATAMTKPATNMRTVEKAVFIVINSLHLSCQKQTQSACLTP
jgi:hypothetical protein